MDMVDSFLADLHDLSDGETDVLEQEKDVGEEFDGTAKFVKTERICDLMQEIEVMLQEKSPHNSENTTDDFGYQLMSRCIALWMETSNQISMIYNFIRDRYRLKFPELESLVGYPIDYARVVKKIGNETDLTLVDLTGTLPAADIMPLSVTATTTSGKPLSQDVLQEIIQACDTALELNSARGKILDFLDSRIMVRIAPNLSAVVGSAVAAKLVADAGGLRELVEMPACNVQVMGAKRKHQAGFSTTGDELHVGYLKETEKYKGVPPGLRERVAHLLATKATLAARVDNTRKYPTGEYGKTLSEEIYKKINKFQESPAIPKPLPVPLPIPKKKRGGRRYRKTKELYAITNMRKLANRVLFGVPEETYLGDGIGEGYGMLVQGGSGRLRVSTRPSKLATKYKRIKKHAYLSKGVVSGMTSSFAISSIQGIELINPDANMDSDGGKSTYFH